jgi:hypothetical protein
MAKGYHISMPSPKNLQLSVKLGGPAAGNLRPSFSDEG